MESFSCADVMWKICDGESVALIGQSWFTRAPTLQFDASLAQTGSHSLCNENNASPKIWTTLGISPGKPVFYITWRSVERIRNSFLKVFTNFKRVFTRRFFCRNVEFFVSWQRCVFEESSCCTRRRKTVIFDIWCRFRNFFIIRK